MSTSSSFWARHPRAVSLALGAGLALLYLVALMATDTMGFTRDESYYFHAGREYAGWFAELEENIDAGEMRESFTQEGIDKHWSYNPEHPVLMKTLFGLSDRYLHAERGWMSPSLAMRFPTMVSGALMIFFTFLFALDAFRSRLAGVAAALSLALLPRLFFHSHLAVFDVGITAAWLATIYAYWRAFRSTPWVWTAGIVWGLALITKLNAFFIPFALLGHLALKSVYEWRVKRNHVYIPPLPAALFTMAVLGPILFYAGWPRHWFDTVERVTWYLEFHLRHEHYFVNYFGQNLWEPPFPWHYPFVMTLATTPVIILLLWFSGGLTMLVDTLVRWRRDGRLFADERATGLLLLINALLPFLVIARPSTPIFGGIKHWFPALPFLAILGGYGVMRFYEWARALNPGASRPMVAALLVVIVAPSAIATWSARDVGTGYYNEAVGNFTGGAERQGMRQFWGYASRMTLDWMNENLPPNALVNFQNTTYGSYAMYKEEHLLRDDIRISYNHSTANCTVFHEQKAFAELEYELWSAYDTMSPSFVADHHGVPMATVYCDADTRMKISARHQALTAPTAVP